MIKHNKLITERIIKKNSLHQDKGLSFGKTVKKLRVNIYEQSTAFLLSLLERSHIQRVIIMQSQDQNRQKIEKIAAQKIEWGSRKKSVTFLQPDINFLAWRISIFATILRPILTRNGILSCSAALKLNLVKKNKAYILQNCHFLSKFKT